MDLNRYYKKHLHRYHKHSIETKYLFEVSSEQLTF